jgi:hypothetical protein
MKGIAKGLATFSIIEAIGHHRVIAGTIMMMGTGISGSPLTPPSIAPQPSAVFSQSNTYGYIIQGLQTNNASARAFELPSTCSANPSAPQTCSFAMYNEFTVDQLGAQEWTWGAGAPTNGEFISGPDGGQRTIFVQTSASGVNSSSYPWWLATTGASSRSTSGPASLGTITGYAPGVFSATAVDGCPIANGVGAREPTVAFTHGQASLIFVVDPGFLCGENSSGQSPQIPIASTTGFGANQPTGTAASPVQTATSCVSNSPTSSQFTVTAHVAVVHGINPGQSFTLAGFTPTGYNRTYIALLGTSGTTLIGSFANGTGTCPGSVTAEGNTGAGSGGAISLTAPVQNTVFTTQNGTGITVKPGQRVCGLVGEFGADSAFPGAQFAKFTDITGADLSGSPAVSPWLNQGAVNFTGFTTAGTQQPTFTFSASISGTTMTVTGTPGGTLVVGQTVGGSNVSGGTLITALGTGTGGAGTYTVNNSQTVAAASLTSITNLPSLTVTAMNSYSLASPFASYNSTTGFVTFTFASNPGLIIGSEFTVSGVSPSGFNQTYVSVAGTSGTTVVGNPLSGPVGMPQANNPGASTGTGGSAVGVIMPGMYFPGGSTTTTQGALISPFGTFGSTGVGGVGTYGLTLNPGTLSITASGNGANQITISGLTSISPQISFGDNVSGTGVTAGTVLTGFVSGTVGSNGVYTTNNPLPSGTIASATLGPLWSAASPGPIFAAAGYYYNLTPSATAPFGSVVPHSQSNFAEFASLIGTSSTTTTTGSIDHAGGWGGAIANMGMLEGAPFPSVNGVPSAPAMTSLCTKATDPYSFASANGAAWRTLYKLNDPGIWGDHSLAEFQGFISGASGSTATLNVSSTQFGSTSSFASGSVISGVGFCQNSVCPTVTSGSGSAYVLSFGSVSAVNIGSSGSPVAMSAGVFQPAKPFTQSSVTGSISGNTLTVTALNINSTFTASYANSPSNGGGTLTTSTSNPTGLLAGQLVWDGGVNIPANSPLAVTGGSGTAWTTNGGTAGFNYLPTSIASETMYSTNTTPRVGDWLMGVGITTPVQITGIGSLTLCAITGFPACGAYTISNPGGLSIPSETMSLSGIQAGGAIAPGAALTVENPGIGATYPVTNWTAMTGLLTFNGEFNNALLHGNPTAIQAQVSATPGGPALSGCSGCAWTNLSNSTISTGAQTWTGSIIGVPAGGPYFVAFRASNGIAYATLPNAVFVGANVAGMGEGNAVDQLGIASPGSANQTYFHGYSTNVGWSGAGIGANWNANGIYIPGPPLLDGWAPAQAGQLLVDRFGVIPSAAGSMNDGMATQNGNASALLGGAPVGLLNMYKNGTGNQNWIYGNVIQSQTIGIGNGSTTTFSSGAGYGGSVSSSAPSIQISGSITAAGVLTVTINNSLSATSFPWSFLNIGQAVSCSTCMAGGPYTGFITTAGSGATGTYNLSPVPTTAISAGTQNLTVTPNNLDFNGAWGFGASINGTVTSNVLTVNSVANGVVAPLLTVSDGTNSATITTCLTNCNILGAYQGTSIWQLSSGMPNETASMTVSPPGGPLWPAIGPQPSAIPVEEVSGVTGGNPIIQVGTFQVLVNGTVYCSDNSTFAYNQQAGNCVDAGSVNRGWVNYVTGGYSITFATAPAANTAVVAQWTNIMTTDASGANEQIDWTGNTSPTSGVLASVAAKAGGVNAYLNGQQCGGGWPDQQLVQARQDNYFFATKMAGLHNGLPNQPVFTTGQWRGLGTQAMFGYFSFGGNLDCEQYDQDAARLSNFSGTISAPGGSSGAYTAKLTLTAAATGTLWEGEAVECNPFSLSCVLPLGTEIIGLDPSSTSGWGASGSIYDLTTDSTTTPFTAAAAAGALAMHNAIFYPGGNAAYVGPYNDLAMQCGNGGGYCVETGAGITGALRYGNRAGVEIGAALSGNPGKGSDPTLDRTTFIGCDSSAFYSPCFDIGSTYAASASGAISGSTVTFSSGLSAGARPFVPGMVLSCAGCTAGRVITSVSLPPTQSTAAAAGQIGQSFTITASGSLGVLTTETVTGGCSGTAGSGSNCIDFKFDINTTGTYGTPASLNTCGENNLAGTNGAATSPTSAYLYPNGQCIPTGVGDMIHGFRIGSVQIMDVQLASNLGSSYDFGMDPGQYSAQGPSGVIVQNEAFTCNIVAAAIVQCIKGPSYSNGAFSSIGKWLSGATYAQFGDPNNAFSFMTGLIGYPGGQSFPFTAGSGYTNGNFVTGGECTLATGAGTSPQPPAMGFNISGGSIINVYPRQIGSSIFSISTCAFPLTFTFTGSTVTGYSAATGLATLNVTGLANGGPTIVPGEVITGGNMPAGGGVVLRGPLSGLTGAYTIQCSMASSCADASSATYTSGPTTGSGGAITTPGLVNIDGIGGFDYINTDNNMSNLMDNSGVPGNPLAGKFNTPAGNLESPGLPVRPFGMRRGTQVSG